jgi:hypothetical protein
MSGKNSLQIKYFHLIIEVLVKADNFNFRIISKRVDDFERIQGVKVPRIRVKCLRITEI